MDIFITFVTTFIGSASGAGVIVLMDYLIKRHQTRKDNFSTAISIQLALNQMLNVLLQLYSDYARYQTLFLDYYKDILNIKNSENMWQEFKHIEIRKFIQTYTYIDLNWNLKQFLTTRVADEDRTLLTYLITARAAYQHTNSILEARNFLFSKIHDLLSNYKKENKISDSNYEYMNENLTNIIGESLNIELKSTTDEYIKSMIHGIEDIYIAFNKLSFFINKKFLCYQSLSLNIKPEMKETLAKLEKINFKI